MLFPRPTASSLTLSEPTSASSPWPSEEPAFWVPSALLALRTSLPTTKLQQVQEPSFQSLSRCRSGLNTNLERRLSQSLYQKLPSTLESVPTMPLLTVHTHRPTSQSAVLWLVRGETRKPVIMNLLSRKVPELILHLLLGTEMKHSYASQTLTALI